MTVKRKIRELFDTKLVPLIKQIKVSRVLQKKISTGLVALALVGIFLYWLHSSRYTSTDDAYVNANIVEIASQVTGKLAKLGVTNNQFAQQGALLFELDEAPFIAAVDKARAQLAMAEADWHNAAASASRTNKLARMKALSKQAEDDAVARLESTIAARALAQANLMQAELDLQHTKVVAPVNGWIASMTLREGNVIAANQPLFALISNDFYWVDANFKETELQNIKPGQKAEIEVDMYPGHVFHGVVDSISKGSGAVFSLLPPQNATGNWVKVTQRVPVKIRILNLDPNYPLRVGTTAYVTIDKHKVR